VNYYTKIREQWEAHVRESIASEMARMADNAFFNRNYYHKQVDPIQFPLIPRPKHIEAGPLLTSNMITKEALKMLSTDIKCTTRAYDEIFDKRLSRIKFPGFITIKEDPVNKLSLSIRACENGFIVSSGYDHNRGMVAHEFVAGDEKELAKLVEKLAKDAKETVKK
jgi:hypothetical protein